MNILDLFVKANYCLYQRDSLLGNKMLSPSRAALRYGASKLLPRYLKRPIKEMQSLESSEDLIVSLTSFPARINHVWQTISCLLRQTYSPYKIILWLSEDQFGSDYHIPESLSVLLCQRFEIRWVKGDICSHKKHYYVMGEFPNALVFLADDDIYYPTDMLERVMLLHKTHPDDVICQYGYRMKYNEAGHLVSYRDWPKVYASISDSNMFFGSGGGTLFCPSKLYKDLRRLDLFTRLTPTADDIWLNAMVRLAGLKVRMLKTGHILPVINQEDVKLASENIGNNKNDEQIMAVSEYYLRTICIDPFAQRQ